MSEFVAMVIGAFIGSSAMLIALAIVGYRVDQRNKATDYSE